MSTVSEARAEAEAADHRASAGTRGQRVDRRLTREVASARQHFLIAGLIGVLSALAIVAQAALLAHIIAAAAMDHATLRSLSGSLVALAAVFVVRAMLSGGFELSGRLGAGRVMSELRGRLVRAWLVESPGQGRDERVGELATVAVQGIDALENYFAGYLPALTLSVTVPIAVLIWVVHVDFVCAVIFVVTIPVLITFMILIGLRANSLTERRWRTLGQLSGHFLDVVTGLETLRAHRREMVQAQTLASVGERYRSETMATLRLAFLSALVLECCAMIGTALVAATIGVQLTGGHLDLQAGLTVLLLAPELYSPLRQVGQQFHASADGLAAAERIFTALDGSAQPRTRSGVVDARSPRRSALCFSDVCFTYPGRTEPVLDHVSCELEPQTMTVLTGPSGAGKSTLAALALGLIEPSSGRVSCGDRDLCQVSAESWQRHCAWVPQNATLFTGTLAENIALHDPGAASARIATAAMAAGLAELVGELADGLQTPVGDGGRPLSAGQRQRVAVARAFLADADLVVLDEPTANLDPRSAGVLREAIIDLARGRTLLVMTHDEELAAAADRWLQLSGGTIHDDARSGGSARCAGCARSDGCAPC